MLTLPPPSRERGHKMKQRWTGGFFPPGKSRSCSCLPLSSCKKSRDCKEEHTLMLMIINSLENGQSRTEVNPETDFLSLRVEWDVKIRRRSQSWPLFHETVCSVSVYTHDHDRRSAISHVFVNASDVALKAFLMVAPVLHCTLPENNLFWLEFFVFKFN